MFTSKVTVESVEKLNDNIYLIKCFSPEISKEIKPGQFCNIKVSDTNFPLLRRPFSISDVDGESICFMFNVHGEGTRILSEKIEGGKLDILAPLGNGFNIDADFNTAIFVAGGLGAAPFPFLTKKLSNKKIITLVGGRNKADVTDWHLKNVSFSTDDGSLGFKGNVVELLDNKLDSFSHEKVKVFACGPTPMLKALQLYCNEKNIKCDLSTECAMACGFGICQGCNCEHATEDKYLLVCKDGPVFDSKEIKL